MSWNNQRNEGGQSWNRGGNQQQSGWSTQQQSGWGNEPNPTLGGMFVGGINQQQGRQQNVSYNQPPLSQGTHQQSGWDNQNRNLGGIFMGVLGLYPKQEPQIRGHQQRPYGQGQQMSSGQKMSEYDYGREKGWFRERVPHEKITFSPNPNQPYRIMSAMGKNMCLDMDTQGNRANLWSYKGSANQKYLLLMENNRITIICCATNSALEVANCKNGDGIDLVMNQPQNSVNQKFHFVPVLGGMTNEFHLRTFCNKVVDICGQATINGAQIFQYGFTGGMNQRWLIQPA